jgi:hypothetical protein
VLVAPSRVGRFERGKQAHEGSAGATNTALAHSLIGSAAGWRSFRARRATLPSSSTRAAALPSSSTRAAALPSRSALYSRARFPLCWVCLQNMSTSTTARRIASASASASASDETKKEKRPAKRRRVVDSQAETESESDIDIDTLIKYTGEARAYADRMMAGDTVSKSAKGKAASTAGEPKTKTKFHTDADADADMKDVDVDEDAPTQVTEYDADLGPKPELPAILKRSAEARAGAVVALEYLRTYADWMVERDTYLDANDFVSDETQDRITSIVKAVSALGSGAGAGAGAGAGTATQGLSKPSLSRLASVAARASPLSASAAK